MLTLNSYIQEKLIINKSVNNKYNPDDLNNDDIVIYSSDDIDEETGYMEMQDTLDNIDNNFYGFLKCSKPLSKIKNFNDNEFIKDLSDDLSKLQKTMFTGRDLGYELKLVGGHLEFICINSGSRATYYVYALSEEAYEKAEAWWQGYEDVPDLHFLMDEGSIEEINEEVL